MLKTQRDMYHIDFYLTKKIVKSSKFNTVRFTMWKFHYFSITQILREINFEVSRSAKSAISTHFEALNFYFQIFTHFEG